MTNEQNRTKVVKKLIELLTSDNVIFIECVNKCVYTIYSSALIRIEHNFIKVNKCDVHYLQRDIYYDDIPVIIPIDAITNIF